MASGVDPGFPKGDHGPIGGHGPLRWALLVKMYVKMKELGPMGGGHVPENFVCRSTNGHEIYSMTNQLYLRTH